MDEDLIEELLDVIAEFCINHDIVITNGMLQFDQYCVTDISVDETGEVDYYIE